MEDQGDIPSAPIIRTVGLSEPLAAADDIVRCWRGTTLAGWWDCRHPRAAGREEHQRNCGRELMRQRVMWLTARLCSDGMTD
jgi:hypothetical protein